MSNVPIGRIEDGALPGPNGPIGIRVYSPIELNHFDKRLPGVIYFHGAGLFAGSLDTRDGLCGILSNEIGYRLILVDYRLDPEHRFPAAVVDGRAATIWAVEHAAELGIDRDRIAIAGDSAGASLAAVICQQRVDLVAQLLLFQITDFAAQTESRLAFARG